jgi:hypothetical protein
MSIYLVDTTLVHAGIMAAQAIYDGHELGHLTGDVPALLLVAAVLWFLSPASQQRESSLSEQSHRSAQPTL